MLDRLVGFWCGFGLCKDPHQKPNSLSRETKSLSRETEAEEPDSQTLQPQVWKEANCKPVSDKTGPRSAACLTGWQVFGADSDFARIRIKDLTVCQET